MLLKAISILLISYAHLKYQVVVSTFCSLQNINKYYCFEENFFTFLTEYESVYHPRLWYRRTLWKQQRADPRKTFNKEAARKTCFWPPSRAQKDIHLTLDVCIRVIFQKNLYQAKRDGKTDYILLTDRKQATCTVSSSVCDQDLNQLVIKSINL